MEHVLDWAQKFSLAIAGALGTFFVWVTVRLHNQQTRLAVLEITVQQLVRELPSKLNAIQATVDAARQEGHTGRKELYEHVSEVRRELRDDIKDATKH